MALFPIDFEDHHTSGLYVPDDENHYAIKDKYARELIDILNAQKSEVYIGKHTETDDSIHFQYCDLNERMFSKSDTTISTSGVDIKSGLIDVEFDGSPVRNYRFNASDTIWEELVTGIEPHVSPIRMRFHTKPSGTTKIIYSDIILSYTEIVDPDNPNVTQDRYFSGTGVIYTGADIDSCVYVAVRMQVQDLGNNYQYDIYVKELALKS